MRQIQGLAWLIRVWVAAAAVMLLAACAPEGVFVSMAETGGPEEQFSLGKRYEEGSFGTRNYERAARWYRKAARQGHQEAQLRLGDLYETGLGVERDLRQARDWYAKAAKRSKDRDIHLCLEAERKRTNVEKIYRAEKKAKKR